MLKKFHVNGDSIGFHAQSSKEDPYKSHAKELSFEWLQHIFRPQTLNVKTTYYL